MDHGSMQGALSLGLLLGMRHAADADHLAVVLSLAAERPAARSAFGPALLWAVGHSLSFVTLGLAIVAFGVRLPQSAETGLEVLVALTLLSLGLPRLLRRGEPSISRFGAARPFAVGSIHGLSGSTAVSLLVLSSIPSARLGIAYVVLSGLGTVVSMLVLTWLSSVCFRAARSVERMHRVLVALAAWLSTALGLFMLLSVLRA